MSNGDDQIHLIHTIWDIVLSTIGGLFWWNWKAFTKTIENKADKIEVETLREMIGEWKVDQQQQHRENRQRLDAIITKLGRM